MGMGALDETTVRLIPDQLFMNQRLNMPIFRITNWRLNTKMLGDHHKGVSMTVVLKRKITSEMMTTYFPSILLMMITYATTFFKPFFFEAALSVNLTTMLVMTTIFISKMEGLPPTSARWFPLLRSFSSQPWSTTGRTRRRGRKRKVVKRLKSFRTPL